MFRFLLKLSLLISVLFALAIGAIRAQPYDDDGLRDFLFNSPGCEDYPNEPCFIGIRPGATTFDEALAMLEAHEWVERVTSASPIIQWTWNGSQPRFIGFPQERGLVTISDGTVRRLYVGYTSIKFSDLWLTLDKPTSFDIATSRAFVDYGTSYSDMHLTTQMIVSCPLRIADFWTLRVNIAYEAQVFPHATDFRFGELCAQSGISLIG